ncbi:MAG: hypothetical protein GX227_10685 [Clostridiaceae bacterium]|nr:hypothetical protein [Clostridiaceae bacterium]
MSDPKYENVGDITTRVMEECAEVIQIVCKVQRFGWNNYHPKDKDKTPNWKLVLKEIDDLEKRISQIKKYIAIQTFNGNMTETGQ